MDKIDYLQLAIQYATFLGAVGGVSITVLTLILNLGSRSKEKIQRLTKRNSRLFLITALIVATVSSFIGAHMLVETAAAITYSRNVLIECEGQVTSGCFQERFKEFSVPEGCKEQETDKCIKKTLADFKEKTSGERLFLLSSTNIFIAALLVLFALMLLPLASSESNAAITPISIWVFLSMTAGIICWLVLGSIYRMTPPQPGFVIGLPVAISLVWLFFLFYISRQILLRVTFISIIFFTVASFGYFALTFYDSGKVWQMDIFFFTTAILFSYMALNVAGIKIMYPRIEALNRLKNAGKRKSSDKMSQKKVKVRIEQMQLHKKPILLSFLREVYVAEPRMSDEHFWDWHFLKNPRVDVNNLPVWLARSGARIVGQLGAIPVALKIGDKQVQAMWILDLIVHEDFRRMGIASQLVEEAEKFCPFGLGVNTEKQYAPALLRKLGWEVVGKVPRYRRALFPGNVAREFSRINPLRRTVNSLFRFLRPLRTKSRFSENGKLREVKKFDSAFDDFWREASAQWTCAVVRDAAFLNWQYSKQPGKQFHTIGYYEGNRLLGYAVLFIRKPGINGAIKKAAITDLCYHPDNSKEIINELLRGALQIAVEQEVGTLVTDVIDPLIAGKLSRFGFIPPAPQMLQQHFKFMRPKNPLQLMVKSSEHEDLLYNAKKWFLTRGDSDISIFEQPNL